MSWLVMGASRIAQAVNKWVEREKSERVSKYEDPVKGTWAGSGKK